MDQITQDRIMDALKQEAINRKLTLPEWVEIEGLVGKALSEITPWNPSDLEPLPQPERVGEPKIDASKAYTMTELSRLCRSRNVRSIDPTRLCAALYGGALSPDDINQLVKSVYGATIKDAPFLDFMRQLRTRFRVWSTKELDYKQACNFLGLSPSSFYGCVKEEKINSVDDNKTRYCRWALDDVVYIGAVRRLRSAKARFDPDKEKTQGV